MVLGQLIFRGLKQVLQIFFVGLNKLGFLRVPLYVDLATVRRHPRPQPRLKEQANASG